MRVPLTLLFALVLGAAASTAVFAQEGAGAGRMEVSAAPGGGIIFTKPAKTEQADFSNYGLGAGFTYNMNRMFGIEGEVGGGVGLKHSFTATTSIPMLDETGNPVLDEQGNAVMGTNTVLAKTLSPRTLAYEGNLVFHPRGNDHALVPYATGGIGGLTLFTRSALRDVGLANDETYLTGNVGAGVKWFAMSGWGLRADYRFLVVKGRTDTSNFFGLNTNRYGHRVYGSVMYTFGK